DDALPSNAGLAWSIDAQDGGWSINGSGHLVYGPTFLVAGGSSHVHVTSPTTAQDCTTILNTASGSSSNEPSGSLGNNSSSASVTVLCASIALTKVADASSVSAGDPIGFTITVTNSGAGVARNVTLNDTLPTDAGTSFSIDGGTYGGFTTCGISAGVLSCGPSDLASGDTYTVHITSPTTSATVADSPVDNSAHVSTSNDGSADASDSVTVLGTSIAISKTADDPSVSAGDQIGFTIKVTNPGPGNAYGVTVTDPLPSRSEERRVGKE